MVNHKAPVDSCAKSGKGKKFISSKSVPGKKSEDQVWKMATWNVHGGLTALIKSIMVSQDLSLLKLDFVALQETQSKLDVVQPLGPHFRAILFPKGSGSGLGIAIANSQWSKVFSSQVYSDRIAVLTLRASEGLPLKFLSIINVHAPTLASTRDDPAKQPLERKPKRGRWDVGGGN
jgi:hypothetical protein